MIVRIPITELRWSQAMKSVRKIAIALLGFLSLSAIVGAVPLILYPSGHPWGYISLDMLQYSPFHSFLIPGIILLLANGVMSLLALYLTVRRRSGYGWWVAFQGCVLAGWIVVEVIMLRLMMWAHELYLAIGLALIVSGIAFTRDRRGA